MLGLPATYVLIACNVRRGSGWFPTQVMTELNKKEKSTLHRLEGCTWQPEYGGWIVEATPRQPFSGYAADLVRVSGSFRVCVTVLSPFLPASSMLVVPTSASTAPSHKVNCCLCLACSCWLHLW